jgi:protein-disulfide isomerase
MRSKGNKQGVLSTAGKIRFVKVGVLVAVCVGLIACTGETDWGPDGLRELKEGQKAILERIEKIEKTQNELLASWQKTSPKRPAVDYNKVYDIEVGESPVRGAKEAKITLIEFSDFQCPYSKSAQPLIEKLLKAYPDDLKHVYKNFPLRFHKEAMPAAKACLAAGMQGKFWEMEAIVFENLKNLKDKDLKEYAREIGLDMEQFEKDFSGEEVDKLVQEDLAEARKASVTGTPTLFLNGKRVQNRSEEAMTRDIQTLLEGQKKS